MPRRDETSRTGFDVESFVRGMVQSHVVKGVDGRQGAYLAAADAVLSGNMRSLMHSDGVKGLERAWRSLHRLMTTLETGETLKIYLLDVSREELLADLANAARSGGAVNSGLYAQLVESTLLAPGAGAGA